MVGERVLEELRVAVREGRVRLTDHAFDELEEDSLHVIDAESAILTGRIVRVEPRAPSVAGPRYTVIGTAADLTSNVAVICRFDATKSVLIITAYEIHQ